MSGKKRSRHVYTPEYRKEAAHLVIDTGRSIAEVARELGLGPQLLGRWVGLERGSDVPVEDGALDVSERAELERLRREVGQLRLDNEFLGKVATFFASKSQNRNCSH